MALSIATPNVCSINGTIAANVDQSDCYSGALPGYDRSCYIQSPTMPKNARGPSGRKASRRAVGKTKKKSVKSRAILGSNKNFLWEEQKKGTRGFLHYISRSRAINNLQLSLNDFRRLCILKGIYPRDPDGLKKPNGKHQSFYHVKDIISCSRATHTKVSSSKHSQKIYSSGETQ